jgi:hypothetical protein
MHPDDSERFGRSEKCLALSSDPCCHRWLHAQAGMPDVLGISGAVRTGIRSVRALCCSLGCVLGQLRSSEWRFRYAERASGGGM